MDLVKFLLEEYSFVGAARATHKVNPRYIIMDPLNDGDETLTLRLAASHSHIFQYLWETYGFLFTDQHLLTVTKYLLLVKNFECLQFVISSATTQTLFLNAPLPFRSAFISLISEAALEGSAVEVKNAIIGALQQYPFTQLDKQVEDEKLQRMYELIT